MELEYFYVKFDYLSSIWYDGVELELALGDKYWDYMSYDLETPNDFVSVAYRLIVDNPKEYENLLMSLRGKKEESEGLTDDEILIIVVAIVAKFFKKKVDNRCAANRGYEWVSSALKIQQYGSRAFVSVAGYNSYINSHTGGDFALFDAVIELCNNNDKSCGYR